MHSAVSVCVCVCVVMYVLSGGVLQGRGLRWDGGTEGRASLPRPESECCLGPRSPHRQAFSNGRAQVEASGSAAYVSY